MTPTKDNGRMAKRDPLKRYLEPAPAITPFRARIREELYSALCELADEREVTKHQLVLAAVRMRLDQGASGLARDAGKRGEKEGLVSYEVRFPTELHTAVREYGEAHDLSMNEVVAEALRLVLRKTGHV